MAISVFYLLLWLFLFSTFGTCFCHKSIPQIFDFFNLIFSIKISTVCMALAEQLSIVGDSDDLTVGGLSLRGDSGVHILMTDLDLRG